MIEVKDLMKDYGQTRAVDGISFRVEPGEVVGLLGPNGAGKSTTLRVLTSYLPPTAGRVLVAGVNVLENSLEARRRVGYLSEVNPLYESLGVWECLELFGRLRGMAGAHLRRRREEVSEACALEDVAHKDVGELSKGYRQRLGLALAILHDPEVLILDEPTSALDPNQQKEVRELILRLKEKKTVLLSTHILPEAQRLCDRLLIIHKGKIVADGTVAELQRRLAGENVFYIRLRAPEEEASRALAALRGVTSAEKKDEAEEDAPGFLVAGPGDVREALVKLAAKHHWPLLELRRHGASLDEIFQTLTGSGGMNRAITLAHKEWKEAFNSPMPYTAMALFFLLMGYFLISSLFLSGQATLVDFFSPLSLLLSIFLPAFTMRLFAEEYKTGTIENLATLPLRDTEIVLGKYAAALAVWAAMLALSLIYWALILVAGRPDFGQSAASFLGALLLGAFYCALGLLASSLTRSQVVGFLLGFLFCFFFFIVGKSAQFVPGAPGVLLNFLGVDRHMDSFLKGVVDSRDILYFLSGSALALAGTLASFNSRRWR